MKVLLREIDLIDSDDPHNGTSHAGGSDRLSCQIIDPLWRTPKQRIIDVFLYDKRPLYRIQFVVYLL